MIIELMSKHEVSHEDLIEDWEAHEHLTRGGSSKKLKSVSIAIQKKVENFYRELRGNGIYPGRPIGGKMTFLKSTSQSKYPEDPGMKQERIPFSTFMDKSTSKEKDDEPWNDQF